MSEPMRPPPTDTAWLETQELRDRVGWMYRAADHQPEHRCQPPTSARDGDPIEGTGLTFHAVDPDGQRGDVWRCNCRQYWVISLACDACEAGGHGDPPAGMCTVGLAWRPVTAWRARRLVRRAERRSR